jgi:hypothetical protein
MSDLVKSKKRVADHGEVFTPHWMVEEMLDMVKNESERIDSRFLEPACGSGNFLVEILNRKLKTVESKYSKSPFERTNYALLGLMCIYGIELLEDNAEECRENLLEVFKTFLDVGPDEEVTVAARNILLANIVRGDAISMLDPEGEGIVFPEWAYLSKGKFSRRDFRFGDLTQLASLEGTLFEDFELNQMSKSMKEYKQLRLQDIASLSE